MDRSEEAEREMIVDSEARRDAASLLRRFRGQELTNDQLVDSWPESADPALRQIFEAIWVEFDDLREHRYHPTRAADDLLRRCIGFLESSHPYSWPVPSPLLRLLGLPLSLVTLGLANRLLWRKYRFPDYWPFPTESSQRQESEAV